jgi:hypothetical protein
MTDQTPPVEGGELAAFITNFEAGDTAQRAALFYELLSLYGSLGEIAAGAQTRITAAMDAKAVAEDALGGRAAVAHRIARRCCGGGRALTAELEAEHGKTRRLEAELVAARSEIGDLTEANNFLGAENTLFAEMEETGRIRVRGVVGFTFIGRLTGGTNIYAQTPGKPKAEVVLSIEGNALTIKPKLSFDPTIFGSQHAAPSSGPP